MTSAGSDRVTVLSGPASRGLSTLGMPVYGAWTIAQMRKFGERTVKMDDVKTLLEPFMGYLSLGMYDDANDALECWNACLRRLKRIA